MKQFKLFFLNIIVVCFSVILCGEVLAQEQTQTQIQSSTDLVGAGKDAQQAYMQQQQQKTQTTGNQTQTQTQTQNQTQTWTPNEDTCKTAPELCSGSVDGNDGGNQEVKQISTVNREQIQKENEKAIADAKARIEAKKSSILQPIQQLKNEANTYSTALKGFADNLFWFLVLISGAYQFAFMALKRSDLSEYAT